MHRSSPRNRQHFMGIPSLPFDQFDSPVLGLAFLSLDGMDRLGSRDVVDIRLGRLGTRGQRPSRLVPEVSLGKEDDTEGDDDG